MPSAPIKLKDAKPFAKCALSEQSWAVRKTMMTLHAVTDATGRPPHDLHEAGRRLCRHWGGVLRGRHGVTLVEHAGAM